VFAEQNGFKEPLINHDMFCKQLTLLKKKKYSDYTMDNTDTASHVN